MSDAGDIQIEGRWAGILTRRPHPEDLKTEATESDFTLYTKDENGTIEIHGEGNGRIDPETNMMYGRWGKTAQKLDRRHFAFHLAHKDDVETTAADRLEAVTGHWSGTYTTPTSTKSCAFELIGETSQGDDQLVIKGNSVSPTPPYDIKGVVSSSGQIIFAKLTHGHGFVYRGTLSEENDSMSGD